MGLSAAGKLVGVGTAGLGVASMVAGRTLGRLAQLVNAQISSDDAALTSAGRLPQVAAPVDLRPHRNRSIFICYLAGMLLGGIAFWLVGLLATIAIYQGTNIGRSAPQGEAIVGPFFWAG